MLFLFVDLNTPRRLVWVKDTVPRLNSWVSTSGWPENKVIIFLLPRSRHCNGGLYPCSCRAA